jgi:hypothetical protein
MGISQVQNRPYNLKYSFSLSILFSKKINVMSQYPHLYGSPTLHIHKNRGNIKSEEKWYLNGESIEICNKFMYLGILLNYNGVFTK